MLAYCGINCQECKCYRGTVNTDLSLLQKASETYEGGKHQPEDWVCLGCTPTNQILAKYCQDCVIRRCALKKEIESCAVCMEYENCQMIQNFLNADPNQDPEENELLIRMNLMHKRFLDSR